MLLFRLLCCVMIVCNFSCSIFKIVSLWSTFFLESFDVCVYLRVLWWVSTTI